MNVKYIADIYTDFDEKFGIPRQSGRVPELKGRVVFRPDFRAPGALKGIEGFSHLWLLFDFSLAHREDWSPTVRPPRLGGNARVGVFASRSPFRPNPIGLSLVKLLGIERTEDEGDVLIVGGADLLSGTPVIDIKPYLPYSDCAEDAVGGYADCFSDYRLTVVDGCPEKTAAMDPDKYSALKSVLAEDPRPSYQNEPDRIYGMKFAGYNVKFRVSDNVLTIEDAEKCTESEKCSGTDNCV